MGDPANDAWKSYEEEPGLNLTCVMNTALYLQIVSILIGVVAVALPILITVVAFVYVRRLTERVDHPSDEIDQLWRRVGRGAPESN